MTHRIVEFAAIALALTAATVVAQEKSTPAATEKPASALTVAEAKLGTGVENRQIVGEATAFDLNQKVYLWLELTGGPADSITVTWTAGDKSYKTMLKVGGPTYHTWAYKTVAVAGPWTVSVTDASGTTLKELEFTVGVGGAK